MRVQLRWLSCAFAVLSGCTAELKTDPATEIVARIDASSMVQGALMGLRVRTASEEGGSWVDRNDSRFAATALSWPVDIVLTPRAGSAANHYFEIIVDALDSKGEILVQTRALSTFVHREKRVLSLSLQECGSRPLSFVCEPDAERCHGPNCLTCINDVCENAPTVASDSLPTLDPAKDAGGLDAGANAPRDAAMMVSRDAASPERDARPDDMPGPVVDAGMGAPDAGGDHSDAAMSSQDAGAGSEDASAPQCQAAPQQPCCPGNLCTGGNACWQGLCDTCFLGAANTMLQLLNACTLAEGFSKVPVIPLANADGTVNPLP